ncbi:hypothetical protein [Streptomyces sp. NPDC002176]|uniref:hypothetical protein n=1 Tax=Streptomyces sp. NPDC002176 TaxID=3364634 RepID=UPI00385002E3
MRDKRDEQPGDEADVADTSADGLASEYGSGRPCGTPGFEVLDVIGLSESSDPLARLSEHAPWPYPIKGLGNVLGASLAAKMLETRGLGEKIRQMVQIKMPPAIGLNLPTDFGRIIAQKMQAQSAHIGAVVERALERIPENLRDLKLGTQLHRVFLVNEEDGTSLAWAPRTSIVEGLLAAPDMAARDTVLLDHVDVIADDVDASLTSVTVAEHQLLRAMLADAVAALRVGL